MIPAAGRHLLAEAQRVDGNPFIVVGYRVKGRAGNVDRAFYRVRDAAGLPKLRIPFTCAAPGRRRPAGSAFRCPRSPPRSAMRCPV